MNKKTKKQNKIEEDFDELEELDLESEFDIKDSDIKFLIKTNEKGNVKILKHHMKKIDEAVNKIEEGLLEVVYTINDIIEQYEEGKIFKSECSEAIDKLLVLAEFTNKMEKEFRSLKDSKESL